MLFRSSPVVNNKSQEEFDLTSSVYSKERFNSTNFLEYAVKLQEDKGITVSFFRKIKIGNIEDEIQMSYKTNIHDECIVTKSTAGLAFNNIAFTDSIVFKASKVLTEEEEIRIYLVWHQ